MDDLALWLTAQLDEDERIARAATDGPWVAEVEFYRSDPSRLRIQLRPGSENRAVSGCFQVHPVAEEEGNGDGGVLTAGDAVHIATHDPARVLREIEAKRRLLDDYTVTARIRDEAAERIKATEDHPDSKDLETWDRAQQEAAILEGPVRLAALPFNDRPGYQEGWAP